MSASYDLCRWITLIDVNSGGGKPSSGESGGNASLLNHIKRRAQAAIAEDDRVTSGEAQYAVGRDGLASLVFILPTPPAVEPLVLLLAANNPADAQHVVDALNAYTPARR